MVSESSAKSSEPAQNNPRPADGDTSSIAGVSSTRKVLRGSKKEEHSVRADLLGWSTISRKVARETQQELLYRHRFNRDFVGYQPRVLKVDNPTVESSAIRKMLFEDTQFAKKHTEDIFNQIMENGWVYVPIDEEAVVKEYGEDGDPIYNEYDELKDVVWTPDEIRSAVETLSRAVWIGTGFNTRMVDGEFHVFDQTEVEMIVGNGYRQIEEVWFYYNAPSEMYFRNEEGKLVNPANQSVAGFLTQYSEEEFRSPSERQSASHYDVFQHGKKNKQIFRDCVVITPKKKNGYAYGIPELKSLCRTALLKEYMTFYEMTIIHKGGVWQNIAVPSDIDEAHENALVKDHQRGLCSAGNLIKINKTSNDTLGNYIIFDNVQIPSLPLQEANDLISEQSSLSQQTVKGTPESGAMGQNASEQMDKKDTDRIKRYYEITEEYILNHNDVFRGKPAYDIENKDGMLKKTPRYRVVFLTPILQQEDTDEEQRMEDQRKTAGGMEKTPKREPETSDEPKKPDNTTSENSIDFEIYNHVSEHELFVEDHSVAIGDYVSYTGNMFQAGVYDYDDRKPPHPPKVYYSKEDIREMAFDEVNRGRLEYRPLRMDRGHSEYITDAEFKHRIGYFEIVGFDEETGKDITKYYIKRKAHDLLLKEGAIYEVEPGKFRFKVSPKFSREKRYPRGNKIMIHNVAVLNPKRDIPRSEISGLETAAERSDI